MLTHSLVACLLTTGPSAAAAAEKPEPLRLTLAEALARARAASAGLGAQRALQRTADAEERVARAGRLPQLALSAGYTRNSDVPELVTFVAGEPGSPPRRQVIFPNITDNYRTRLELTLPLYTGGRLAGLIAAAGSESRAAAHEVVAADADLVLETTTAYWSLVTSEESERVLAASQAGYDAHIEDARNRERFGLAARNEVLAVQVERDRAELARLAAQSAARLNRANLARLLAWTDAAALVAVEPLERAAVAREDPDALLAAALEARPERAALLARLVAADARVRAERGARRPQVSVAAGYDYANPNRKILPPLAEWNDTWDLSLTVAWSVFDGGRASAGTARARARAEAARYQLDDLERRIRLQVVGALLELDTAEAAVAVAERGLAAARENLRVAADRHREGLIPSSERLDAELALQRANLDRTETLARVRLAEAGLARALGK